MSNDEQQTTHGDLVEALVDIVKILESLYPSDVVRILNLVAAYWSLSGRLSCDD